jgi:hypothetical protein
MLQITWLGIAFLANPKVNETAKNGVLNIGIDPLLYHYDSA